MKLSVYQPFFANTVDYYEILYVFDKNFINESIHIYQLVRTKLFTSVCKPNKAVVLSSLFRIFTHGLSFFTQFPLLRRINQKRSSWKRSYKSAGEKFPSMRETVEYLVTTSPIIKLATNPINTPRRRNPISFLFNSNHLINSHSTT